MVVKLSEKVIEKSDQKMVEENGYKYGRKRFQKHRTIEILFNRVESRFRSVKLEIQTVKFSSFCLKFLFLIKKTTDNSLPLWAYIFERKQKIDSFYRYRIK